MTTAKVGMSLLSLLMLLPAIQASGTTVATVTANADAYIQGGTYSNQKFGTGLLLLDKYGTNLTYTRKVYLRFGLDAPGTTLGDIVGAELLLTPVDSGAGLTNATTLWEFAVYGLNEVNGADPAWGESTITWNNAPGNDKDGAWLEDGEVTSLGSFFIQGKGLGTTATFSSDAFKSFLGSDGDASVTLIIVGKTPVIGSLNYVHAFDSRESTAYDTPKLTYSYGGSQTTGGGAAPEPVTAFAMGGAVVALGAYLRRRGQHVAR